MQFKSQAVAKPYFIAAIGLFVGQILFGLDPRPAVCARRLPVPRHPVQRGPHGPHQPADRVAAVWLHGRRVLHDPGRIRRENCSAGSWRWPCSGSSWSRCADHRRLPGCAVRHPGRTDWQQLLETMGREFLEQPLPTKLGIVVVWLAFLFNIT